MKKYIQNLGENLHGVASKHINTSKSFNEYLTAYGKAQHRYLPRGGVYNRLIKIEVIGIQNRLW